MYLLTCRCGTMATYNETMNNNAMVRGSKGSDEVGNHMKSKIIKNEKKKTLEKR